jgi:hypothetical protein
MNESPNDANRLRQELAKRIQSWFGPDPEESNLKPGMTPVILNMNGFRDPSERRATIESMKKAGIPFIAKYE